MNEVKQLRDKRYHLEASSQAEWVWKRVRISFGVLDSLFSFFLKRELDTSAWEETDDWLLSFSNDEDVTNSSGEGVTLSVLNVSDIEATWVLFNVLEDTDSTNVVTTSDQD